MKKVKLLRDVRPFGRTGEAVEVSPEHCEWLTSLGMAVEVEEAGEQAEKPETAEKVTDAGEQAEKLETAEKVTDAGEQAEKPETAEKVTDAGEQAEEPKAKKTAKAGKRKA